MIRYMYKDAFAVIGKMGQGSAGDVEKWGAPLWDVAISGIKEIEHLIRKTKTARRFIGVP